VAEALLRYRDGESLDPVYGRLLGIPVDRAVVASGRAFCDAVAAAAGEPGLSSMWAGPEALPSLPELDEPTLWLARSL
jgi:uncharacterized protein (DUF2342 family)